MKSKHIVHFALFSLFGMMAGCGTGAPPFKVEQWGTSPHGFALERRAEEPGTKRIELPEDASKEKRTESLWVRCTIRPDAIWEKEEGGKYRFLLSNFRLLTPDKASLPAAAVGVGLKETGYSDAPIQTRSSADESTFMIFFAVDASTLRRSDLRVQFRSLPASPLSDEMKAR